MWFAVISIFPEYFGVLQTRGITRKAFDTNQAQLITINPRDFTSDNYSRVDDKPYGGGAGMVMMPAPLVKAIKHAKRLALKAGKLNVPVVYLSPQGKTLDDKLVDDSLVYDGMILICGRYDGIDQRVIDHYVDFECSIGDYVLSGGELAALVYLDAVIRKLPDVLGSEESLIEDSFVGGLLDYPQYTKPNEFEGNKVPDVLTSGDHSKIKQWRFVQQYSKTQSVRPDMIKKLTLTTEQSRWLSSMTNEK